MMEKMKEIYYLNKKSLPTIPVPHDCIIKSICLREQCIEFVFEDDISYHDSIQYYKPEAKSLVIKYHFAYDVDDYSIYKWVTPKKPFSKDGHYKHLDNRLITKLSKGKFKLEYLYHNVGYCSIITKLFSNGYIILDAEIDYVEFDWIC